MFRLRTGYLMSGIITGFIIILSLVTTLPDGKLHIIACNVGQGDAFYILFPDGRDMLVDGGPNNQVLRCLGDHMPFWDRKINMVVLTHPQKDHLQGLIEVVKRYDMDYFVRSDVVNTTEGFEQLLSAIHQKNISVKLVTQGDRINIGTTTLSMLWPSVSQIAKAKDAVNSSNGSLAEKQGDSFGSSAVQGATTIGDLNDYSVVFWLRFGTFDALFPGDADTRVEENYRSIPLADTSLELLKVPHHGSKTGISKDFIQYLKPKIALISSGKNSYGHPAPIVLDILKKVGTMVMRTDESGDIEVISDGNTWSVKRNKK